MGVNLLKFLWLSPLLSSAFLVEDSFLPSESFRRVIVISDIHGDASALLVSLYLGYKEIVGPSAVSKEDFFSRFQSIATDNMPSSPLYTGGDVALIQMGDLIDRGKYSLAALRLINTAEAIIGFKTITLLGNHELYAMLRDNLYDSLIHPDDDLRRDPQIFDRSNGTMWRVFRTSFMPMVRWGPPARAHTPESPLNLSSPATLFVHAGFTEDFLYRFNILTKPPTYVSKYMKFSPDFFRMFPMSDGSQTLSVESINTMIQADFTVWSNERLTHKYSYEWSPFVTREFGEVDLDCASIDRILRLFDVSRIVVGHLPSAAHQVRTNCDGKILLTDIEASRYMRGPNRDTVAPSPGIVIMTADQFADNTLSNITAVYQNVISHEVTYEPIWANNSEQIQSINRWAKTFHDSVIGVSPSIDGSPRSALYPHLIVTTPTPPPPAIEESPEQEERVAKRSRTEPIEFSIDLSVTSGIGSPLGSSPGTTTASPGALLSPTVQIYETLFKDGLAMIQTAMVDGVDGLVLSYFSELSFRLTEIVRSDILGRRPHMNFPQIVDIPNNVPRTRFIGGGGAATSQTNIFVYRKFLATESTMLLHCYEADFTEQMFEQLMAAIKAIHSQNLCLGILYTPSPSAASIMEFFGINVDTGLIQLINFSRLHQCADESEKRREIESMIEQFLE